MILSLEFSNISHDEAVQALFLHGTGLPHGSEVSQAAYTLFFRPKAHIRQKLSELAQNDVAGFEALRTQVTTLDYETFFTGKSTADFNDSATYKELVGDFENIIFPSRIDESKFGLKIPHQLSVSKEVSFTFIKALRDVVTDFYNNRTNPLLTLLKGKSGEIDSVAYAPIKAQVMELNAKIEGLSEVQEIRDDIRSTIKGAVGGTYAPSALSIRSNLDHEADKLLQSLKLHIGEPGEMHEGSVHELSLGGANLIFLTLKLLEFKYRKSRATCANFLLIEEPEAHIHTHIQRTLFDKLNYKDTQIIYSTHSTHISEVCNISNMNVLGRKEGFAEVYQPSVGLTAVEVRNIERYLDAIRSNLLFAKGVLLVEGDAEEILIPILVKRALGVNLDELGLSLINIRSTGFENVAQIFNDLRIKRKCSILTDLDADISSTTPLAGDLENEMASKVTMNGSEDSGLRRRVKLDALYSANPWVKVFYADHTFEVDFVKAGNTNSAIQAVSEVYTAPPTVKQAINDLTSTEVAVYGKRILTMAENKGKGWFAILLGKHVGADVKIPDYILDALIHAKGSFEMELVCEIATHCLYCLGENNTGMLVHTMVLISELQNVMNRTLTLSDFIDKSEALIPDAQVSHILRKVQPHASFR